MITSVVANVAHPFGEVSAVDVGAVRDVLFTKVAVVVAIPALPLCEHGLLLVWAVFVHSILFYNL